VTFIADSTTLTSPDHPVLVEDLLDYSGRPPFRCIPSELWGVGSNLNIANMDWGISRARSTNTAFSAASACSQPQVFAVSRGDRSAA
jgi:hypothetical protein